jgi:hypothetical protein
MVLTVAMSLMMIISSGRRRLLGRRRLAERLIGL